MITRTLVDGRMMAVSDHAIEQYRERVKPALEIGQCARELRHMLRHAEIHLTKPDWAREFTSMGRIPDEWVSLNEAILFPVRENVLVTCLTRGGVGAEVRVLRTERRKRRKQRPAKKHGKVERQVRREIRDRRQAGL